MEVSESAEEDSHSAEEDSDRGESHSEQHSDADSDEQDIPSPASTPTATSTSPEPHRRLPLSSQSKKQLKAIQTAQSPRTVFVGNVPLASALTRPARKAFKRFIQQQLHDLPHESNTDPDARKIESYRFRSLPLDVSGAKDTNELATNAHSNQRGQQWRSQGFRKRKAGTVEDEEFDAAAKQSKVFLSAQQKRKVAYITGGQGKSKEGAQEAEKGGGSCSAYIVLANPHLVQPLAAALDGASFDGRTLRSDTVDAEKKQNMDKSEERRTLFIGGLPYSESEEGVRTFVEQLLANSAKGSSQSPAMSSWVKRVRMVRDPATGAGKGIAYVLLHVRFHLDHFRIPRGADFDTAGHGLRR